MPGRNAFLTEAETIIHQPDFTHESSARVNALLELADWFWAYILSSQRVTNRAIPCSKPES